MAVTYPRIIHSEMMTHRVFSRNSASSRAIPASKMIQMVQDEPFIPIHWGKNQPGMQAKEEIPILDRRLAAHLWEEALKRALQSATYLTELGVHKQIVNRILEPFAWITVIITATEWENFFAQRCHPDAEPHIRKVAEMMRDALYTLTWEERPIPRKLWEWHLPYITDEDRAVTHQPDLIKASVARCARVSYLNHDGTRDINKDLELYEKLEAGGHWSPFEHVAQVVDYPQLRGRNGNFKGQFAQWRKTCEAKLG